MVGQTPGPEGCPADAKLCLAMSYKLRDIEQILVKEYQLDPGSLHGPAHWERVKQNGLYLASQIGADSQVVNYFACFHDSCRQNEGYDPEHGARGAEKAVSMRHMVSLTDAQFRLLLEACRGHTNQLFHENKTIACCWDADRLDLSRVGINPDPKRLNTEAAKLLTAYDWASRRRLVRD